VRRLTRSQADARLRVIRPKMQRTSEGRECRVLEKEMVVADGVDVSAAARVTAVQYSRPRTTVSNPKDPSGNPLLWWLVAISVGCLLVAMVCAAALSRFGSASAVTSRTVPVDQELDAPTFYEIDEGESLARLGPALSR
jgi:hypothetical protein